MRVAIEKYNKDDPYSLRKILSLYTRGRIHPAWARMNAWDFISLYNTIPRIFRYYDPQTPELHFVIQMFDSICIVMPDPDLSEGTITLDIPEELEFYKEEDHA